MARLSLSNVLHHGMGSENVTHALAPQSRVARDRHPIVVTGGVCRRDAYKNKLSAQALLRHRH